VGGECAQLQNTDSETGLYSSVSCVSRARESEKHKSCMHSYNLVRHRTHTIVRHCCAQTKCKVASAQEMYFLRYIIKTFHIFITALKEVLLLTNAHQYNFAPGNTIFVYEAVTTAVPGATICIFLSNNE